MIKCDLVVRYKDYEFNSMGTNVSVSYEEVAVEQDDRLSYKTTIHIRNNQASENEQLDQLYLILSGYYSYIFTPAQIPFCDMTDENINEMELSKMMLLVSKNSVVSDTIEIERAYPISVNFGNMALRRTDDNTDIEIIWRTI